MRIAGIDPGSQRCGYAVIEVQGSVVRILDFGVWNLLKSDDGRAGPRPNLGDRLERLHARSRAFFEKWNPHLIGFEKAVSFKNVASAMVLSEARGVLRLAAFQSLGEAEKRFHELSPTAVKRHSAGLGVSAKTSVMKVLAMRFQGLESLCDGPDFSLDAVDALAIAWTAWILSKTQARTLSQDGMV